jgi:16S rRNA (guanine1207-N2)-methyltransferase
MSQYFENDKNIKSQIRMLTYSYDKHNFDFYSDNGVFSKNEVDLGTILLMETFIKENKCGKVLDVGGGLGIISIVLAKVLGCSCDMVEINDRAIDLACKNVKINGVMDKVNVIKSNAYENVSDQYDYVITNPPIRAGKKVVYEFLFKAFDHIDDNGELWFVMRKNHGALSAIKDLENSGYKCVIKEKDKGFFIIKVCKDKK